MYQESTSTVDSPHRPRLQSLGRKQYPAGATQSAMRSARVRYRIDPQVQPEASSMHPFFGRCWRRSLFVFSFVPRCQGLRLSQKYTGRSSSAVSFWFSAISLLGSHARNGGARPAVRGNLSPARSGRRPLADSAVRQIALLKHRHLSLKFTAQMGGGWFSAQWFLC